MKEAAKKIVCSLFYILLVLSLVVALFAASRIIYVHVGYRRAQQEYKQLRRYSRQEEADVQIYAAGDENLGAGNELMTEEAPESTAVLETEKDETLKPEVMPDLSDINPDYAGWIRIEGTDLDYPVVRGLDNSYYLNRTFGGEKNSAGSIFMDYRCADGFDGSVSLLYGHNMKDGSMFSPLKNYLDEKFLEEHSEISIAGTDGEFFSYRVSAVKITDVNDAAYTLPDEDGLQEKTVAKSIEMGVQLISPDALLILSTCLDTRDEDERLLIFAQREIR